MTRSILMPNGFLAVGDGHVQPGEVLPFLQEAREYCDNEQIPLIYGGDMKDILMLGVDAYGHIIPQPDYYVLGNHEGKLGWLKKTERVDTYCSKSLLINVNGVKWYIEHGDRFTLDWGLFRWLFMAIAWVGMTFFRKRWAKFCLKRWSPKVAKESGETDKYTGMKAHTHASEFGWCCKHKVNGIFGHTHYAEQIPYNPKPTEAQVYDWGDARDGSCVRVWPDGTAEILWKL